MYVDHLHELTFSHTSPSYFSDGEAGARVSSAGSSSSLAEAGLAAVARDYANCSDLVCGKSV